MDDLQYGYGDNEARSNRLKDHLGNVRLTFTAKPEVDEWNADYEADTGTQFEYYNEAVRINSEVFDHTNVGSTHYSGRLNGTLKERFGLAKSLKVMPGDIVRAEVYAKYLDPDTAWVNGMPAFINSIVNGTAPAGTFKDGGLVGSTGGVLMPFWVLFADDHDDGNDDAPKAYLNWLVFDNDYNLIPSQSSYKQISTAGREYGQDGSHDLLETELAISESGYVYLYVSNDHYELEGEVLEVYFDDFRIEHIKSPVIQSEDFYPFGLSFNSFNRENSLINKYLYNGKEKQDALDLGWFDYGAR
ncbi:MAG TPA: hypothetical protein VK666_16060, partial [Chryseolinea sp.]|nr:hypothetical protein [Chryseolinea sp.]